MSANDTTGTVSVTCSASIVGAVVSYEVQLSAGNGGSFSPRKMSNGTFNLNYNLYTDASRTQIWGDTTSGTVSVTNTYTMVGTSATTNHTAYGRVPALQNVGAGSYSDSITATVIF